MEPATAPYILRSLYKDDHVVETQLVRPATELMTNIMGAQFTNQHDTHIAPAMKGLYTVFALAKGQTLGQEFCDMLPATRGGPWRLLGPTRKLLLGALFAAEPSALFYAARRLFPGVPPHDVTANVARVVMCLLFLFERYGTLPHRLLAVRHLSLKPAAALAQGDGARGSYVVLGLVILVELVVRAWRHSRSRRDARLETEAAREATSSSDDDEDAADATTGKCMLCLSHRKSPTAAACGHVFCWNCIAEWIRSNPNDAICPFCRQHIAAQSLVPLFFYAANPQKSFRDGDDDSSDSSADAAATA